MVKGPIINRGFFKTKEDAKEFASRILDPELKPFIVKARYREQLDNDGKKFKVYTKQTRGDVLIL
jgi:hypothetical protein